MDLPVVQIPCESARLMGAPDTKQNWLLAGCAAATTFAVCMLASAVFSQSSASQMYVTTMNAPAATALGYTNRPVIASPSARYAVPEEAEDFADFMARSKELLTEDEISDATAGLDDDDIEIPSEGQKRRIRRQGYLDVSQWQKHENDVGSTEVQIARVTARIAHIASHLAENRQDKEATRRIMELTAQRRKMLNYLWKRDPGAAVDLIQDLGIRWRTPDKVASLVPRSGPVEILIPEAATRPRTIPKANQEAAATAP
jgi:small subunit ribosomal protein S15|uniref:30S ribosomal protein S15 n=1 Tax=Eutreptiella gymnastica TaxID=73025 RepID=A0A7S4G471_9EUGL|eukprot:CAMPEP_0174298516 /NCGR_PEP_ID=MMETSP0809-20121228/53946_1 /TAXON_ID=73025 ORGANISM="Eutreptiella gymnastica-like, Strain CCMP1594" /NCGR_SAMPLE_ID=MMETSP0809 /ASSEMBLY_ACC=CAM_ASM_000658 /LENGTH=257 /DNA_ID=CAMNT_0015402991 /DNA_START=40 /DNA_END=813 /DNA_ORIENTATION=-